MDRSYCGIVFIIFVLKEKGKRITVASSRDEFKRDRLIECARVSNEFFKLISSKMGLPNANLL